MTGTTARDFHESCIAALDAHEFDRVDEFVHDAAALREQLAG